MHAQRADENFQKSVTRPASVFSETSVFRFGSIERAIELKIAPDFIDRISRLMSGWSIAPWTGPAQKPVIGVTHENDFYVVTSDWLEQPLHYLDHVDAACAFFAQLLSAYSQARPDLFLLHAGAASIDGKLIVFPAAGNIGKSTLSSVLAAKGSVVFSDDALPVSLDRRTGSAIGIGPRPRLPLPESLEQETRTFIDSHIGLSNANFAYLALQPENVPGGLAPRGTEIGIGAFVIPDRTPDADPSDDVQLLSASGAETMAQLIGQHLGKRPPAREMVEKLAALIGDVPCRRLRYSNTEQAAKFLIENPPFAAQ